MIEVPVYLNMLGASGVAKDTAGNNVIFVPQQYRGQIAYINFQNLTDNTIKVYAPHDNIGSANPVYTIGARMMFSLKLTQNLGEGVQLFFTNPDATSNTIIKPLEIFWTDSSKGWNHSLAQSYIIGSPVSAVITNPLQNGHVAVELASAGTIYNNELKITANAINAVKTVDVVVSELYVGDAKLAGRKKMKVYNEGANPIYYGVGNNTITAGVTGTGQPIQPMDYEVFYFDPTIATSIYAIATIANPNIKISETT